MLWVFLFPSKNQAQLRSLVQLELQIPARKKLNHSHPYDDVLPFLKQLVIVSGFTNYHLYNEEHSIYHRDIFDKSLKRSSSIAFIGFRIRILLECM